MIDYEKLQEASKWTDLSPNIEGEDWGPEEGIDYEDVLKFCAEDSAKVAMLPWPGPHSAIAMGMIMGIRYANLVHRVENADPNELLK